MRSCFIDAVHFSFCFNNFDVFNHQKTDFAAAAGHINQVGRVIRRKNALAIIMQLNLVGSAQRTHP